MSGSLAALSHLIVTPVLLTHFSCVPWSWAWTGAYFADQSISIKLSPLNSSFLLTTTITHHGLLIGL